MRTGAKPTRPITSLLLAFMVLHVFNAANVRLGVPRMTCLSGRNRSAPIVKEHFYRITGILPVMVLNKLLVQEHFQMHYTLQMHVCLGAGGLWCVVCCVLFVVG